MNYYILACLLASLSIAASQSPSCAPSPLVTSPRLHSQGHDLYRNRALVGDGTLCRSDPRASERKHRMRLNVLVTDENCQNVGRARVFVSQPNSLGHEQEDCGGEFMTNSEGRFTVDASRPGRYVDPRFPGGKRPRLIQLEVLPREGCEYANIEENVPHVTQFYFQNDGSRRTDPCPYALCHADKATTIFDCMKADGLRVCTAHITVPEIVCFMPTTPPTTPAPTTTTTMATTMMTEPATTEREEVTTTRPRVCTRLLPTRWDSIGPFYKDRQPYRNPMCTGDSRYNNTLKLTINLKVSDRSCRSLPNFNVDIWSADSVGEYRDYCRSLLQTNSSGMLTLDTIIPAIYPGRPRHLHYRVHRTTHNSRCYADFFTQSYFPARFDWQSLVKSCRDMVIDGLVKGMICDFSIVLNDPRPWPC